MILQKNYLCKLTGICDCATAAGNLLDFDIHSTGCLLIIHMPFIMHMHLSWTSHLLHTGLCVRLSKSPMISAWKGIQPIRSYCVINIFYIKIFPYFPF